MAKTRTTRGSSVRKLLAELTGHTVDDGQYVGKKVFGRKGSEMEKVFGTVTNTGICRLSGCGGTSLHVLWSDGHRTYPCAKGCIERENGDLEIR